MRPLMVGLMMGGGMGGMNPLMGGGMGGMNPVMMGGKGGGNSDDVIPGRRMTSGGGAGDYGGMGGMRGRTATADAPGMH